MPLGWTDKSTASSPSTGAVEVLGASDIRLDSGRHTVENTIAYSDSITPLYCLRLHFGSDGKEGPPGRDSPRGVAVEHSSRYRNRQRAETSGGDVANLPQKGLSLAGPVGKLSVGASNRARDRSSSAATAKGTAPPRPAISRPRDHNCTLCVSENSIRNKVPDYKGVGSTPGPLHPVGAVPSSRRERLAAWGDVTDC